MNIAINMIPMSSQTVYMNTGNDFLPVLVVEAHINQLLESLVLFRSHVAQYHFINGMQRQPRNQFIAHVSGECCPCSKQLHDTILLDQVLCLPSYGQCPVTSARPYAPFRAAVVRQAAREATACPVLKAGRLLGPGCTSHGQEAFPTGAHLTHRTPPSTGFTPWRCTPAQPAVSWSVRPL